MTLLRPTAVAVRSLALLGLTLVAACGADGSAGVGFVPTYVLTPAALSVFLGDSAAFMVTSPDVRSATHIRVVSSAPSVAAVDSTATLGTPIRVRAAAAGTAILTIFSTADGTTVSTSLPVTVAPRMIPPFANQLTPSAATIGVGDTVRFSATFTNTTARDQGVTFTSTDTTIVTVDPVGLARGRGVGVALIRAARRETPNVIAVAQVTVRPRDAAR